MLLLLLSCCFIGIVVVIVDGCFGESLGVWHSAVRMDLRSVLETQTHARPRDEILYICPVGLEAFPHS